MLVLKNKHLISVIVHLDRFQFAVSIISWRKVILTLTSIPGNKNTVLLSGPLTLGVSPSGLNFLAVWGDVDIDLSALQDREHHNMLGEF